MAVFSRISRRSQEFDRSQKDFVQREIESFPGETLDALFDGRLLIAQGIAGYRFSIDALMLAHFVAVRSGDRIVDLGSGNGVIAMVLGYFHPAAHIVGVELQSSMIARARRSIRGNCLAGRVQMVQEDVRRFGRLQSSGAFDVAVCNPPYRRAASGRMSAGEERRLARHELNGGLADFVAAASCLVKEKGRVALVHLAARSVDVMTAMRQNGIEPKRVRMVHSRPGAAASLLLAEGVKGGKAGLTVHSPLILYRSSKQYTAEAAALIAGKRA
jgi:tRNA1Val (adenine37-N6)-methyltransferase